MSHAKHHNKRALSDAELLADLAEVMSEVEVHDSACLSDTAISLILECEDEKDAVHKSAQLEMEMIKSLESLSNSPPLGA